MNLLIVDDIPTNRKLLRVTLEAEGHTTLEAADGVEALQILAREKVDAVISDILMPNMDGYRLCSEVRKDARFSHLPFIVYTATYTSPSDEKLCVDIGADRFIRKPASSKAIIAELEEVIATGRRSPAGVKAPIDETAVMKEYSERLVAKLEERTIELEQRIRLAALLADVGTALTHGNSLREILQRCSEALVRHLDAAFARIWTHNEREKMLELQASAGIYTHLDGPHGRVPVGKFKIGLIAEERKPHLTNAVIGDPRVSEQEWARREGLVSFAGYPLIIGDRVAGVMAMFARHSLSQATLEAMASIADGLALGIERNQAGVALKERAEELARSNNELLRFNRAAIGRELRMVELKRQVNQLSAEAGKPAPYALSFLPKPAVSGGTQTMTQTTKKDGHGFGAQSAVAAAKEMGGAPHVHSAGADHATLELPC